MIRLLALVLVLGAPPVLAGDVYVWTDQDGRRQISDVVPEKFRNRAKKVDVPTMPTPPAEDTRSAASGGSAAPTAAMDCDALWKAYDESRECIAFNEYALRGFDADPRANCTLAPPPPSNCESPRSGISSR